MVGHQLGQAAVDGKGATPVTVLFTVGDQGRIGAEAIEHRFKERVAVLVDLVLRHRLAVGVEGEAFLFGDLLHAQVVFALLQQVRLAVLHLRHPGIGEHDLLDRVRGLLQAHARRDDRVDRQADGLGDGGDDEFVDCGEVGFCGQAGQDEVSLEALDRVMGHPGILLFLGAVGVGVGRRMAGVAVGHGLEKDRALLVFQDLEFSGHGLDHGQRVVAVDALGVHLVRVDTGADAGDKVVAHGLAAGLAAHRVLVVHDVEHQGQAALHLVIPEQAVLVHRGQHQAFPDRAAGHRAITDIGDDHARLAVDFLVQR